MKKLLPVLLMFTLIINSCNEPDYCDIFNHHEPSFLFVNILDQTNNENLLFGGNSSISIDAIDVKMKMDDTTYTSGTIRGVLNNQDSVLLIYTRELFSPSLKPPLAKELIINYNNQFPTDTIHIEYVEGDCENTSSVAYDYNISSNTGDICVLCFNEVIDILK
jgi:hypothetical protein